MGMMHFAVFHKGQVQTCSFCSKPGHKCKVCPNRLKENTDNSKNEEPKKRPTQQVDFVSDDLMNPPEESNESISNLVEMIFRPNQKTKVSTLLEMRSRELRLNRRKFQRMIQTNSILIRKMRSKD
ncbi:unnamed protein product [Clavelina lepadiformis]|uniref:CCHC-type domain-containing protein n=1 Tax=Clavelina lepadiformis TaxID=159417 RepID=A0ABP0F4C8_CLALP